ncbi:hypothetical protein FLM9_1354 [Candidatus Synechococcus spongiarum]|uniref:Uncharacterized protein n=1 Tax=Candidatus Synechococcus spongiarum TaxID=431041 RepID=A0A165AGN7_9SYNE|nr:hypothetical protein FLM9_1354 [Candidatus Synechococcus spongiarum]
MPPGQQPPTSAGNAAGQQKTQQPRQHHIGIDSNKYPKSPRAITPAATPSGAQTRSADNPKHHRLLHFGQLEPLPLTRSYIRLLTGDVYRCGVVWSGGVRFAHLVTAAVAVVAGGRGVFLDSDVNNHEGRDGWFVDGNKLQQFTQPFMSN